MDHDYNLRDLDPDAIYNLLPYVVRAQDPGVIHTFFKALAQQHNFLVGKLREMPRSQDPTLSGRFEPSDLGESPVLFQEWLVLKRLPSRTSTQELRISALALQVPASIAAHLREQMLLRLLAGVVGETLESGLPDFALRPLLATAIQRHHIKGGSVSFELLGRILGVFELKVSELWTRFSIRNPADPSDPANDGDFATAPEQYPYWPRADRYDSPDERQWPRGGAGYDPFVLDDGGITAITFEQLVTNRRSQRYYLAVVNDRNPFLNFLGEVSVKLVPGTYNLQGGTRSARAAVRIPFRDGSGTVTLQAITTGSYGNQIAATVSNEQSGSQKIVVEGPRSRIKFKSSVFDLVFGIDANTFYSLLPAVPVQRLPDTTALDTATGRTPPDYPVTGTVVGTQELSDPALHYQMDLDGFNDAMTVLRNLVEDLRPATRTIRRKALGLVLSSFVRYAPSCAMLSVVLTGSTGARWALRVSGGTVSWEPTTDAATVVPVQYDQATGRWVAWSYGASGFSTVPVTQSYGGNLYETVVFIRDGGGFVYVEDGALRSAGSYPRLTDIIHGDGTPDESVISPGYGKVSDRPAPDAAAFMSADGVSADEPPPCLIFQTAPEDDLQPLLTLSDPDKFHVAAHFGTEARSDGDFAMNWYYGTDGEMIGADLRTRSAGIGTDLIDPVPTGDSGREDGLVLGYPVQFLDLHGKYVTRDRVTGEAVWYEYNLDSPDADTGGQLLGPFTLSSMDGPVEGGEIPGDWIAAESLDGGVWDANTTEAWRRWRFLSMVPSGPVATLDSDGGDLRVNGIVGTSYPIGSLIVLEGTSYALYNDVHMVVSTTATSVTTATEHTTAATGGTVWHRQEPIRPEGVRKFRLTLRGDTGAPAAYSLSWRLWAMPGGSPELVDQGTLTPGATVSSSYDLVTERIWVETTGPLSGDGEIEFDGLPVLARSGGLAAKGGERDDLRVILTNDGEYWWQYAQSSGDFDSLDPLDSGGQKWWHGGNFRGEIAGTYIGRGTGMPDELVLEES